ncbi:MAG TPA: DEAD/DEAH box helicase [Bacteriovoracaceae bacterium]|nr:DEAD/DEAH box helicase [Bacteriovoracaceae bacterium]
MTPSPWSELNLSPELVKLIEEASYKVPTPVQLQSIPHVLQGKDVLVSSQTGSGKTASFVLPIVEKFKGKNGTYILALSPTREIAQQTGAVFETFGTAFGLKTAVCIGGASLSAEKEALSSSPHIIVATPGRLCDHLERGNVWLDFIQCLVFDEADRMLDMGFANQIKIITDQLPKERQTLMFSATFAPSVERLAREVLKDPVQVSIQKEEGSTPKIDQRLLWMSEDRKLSALMRIIREEPGTIIVFLNSKEYVYRIWRSLQSKGFNDVTYITSDLPQDHREAAVADFKSGKYRVLIATDVMGRGIDVDDVAHVVNFDIPREAADYVHRIGRTGRRGKTGVATTLAVPVRDERGVRAIEKLLGIPSPEMPPRDASSQRPPQGRGRVASPGGPRSDGPHPDGPRPDRPARSRGPRPDRQDRPDRPGQGPDRADRPPREPGPRKHHHQNPRPADLKREHRADERNMAKAETQKDVPLAVVDGQQSKPAKKPAGVLGWVKGLFKK